MDRRHLLQAMGVGAAGSLPGLSAAATPSDGSKPGSTLYEPRTFGALGDGKRLDSPSINAAIDACNRAGGGVVYLRPGVYLSGTVVLKSRVTLFLEAGATILGSKNIGDYTPQPGPEAKSDAGQKHLIFARDAEDVRIAGPGLIDGQGRSFWVPSGRKPLPPEEHWRDVATYDAPTQPAKGIVETWVSGQSAYVFGAGATDARAGRLVTRNRD